MDISSVAAQLINALNENPELVSRFAQHPYSTTVQAVGSDDKISQSDMGEILTQVAAQVCGTNLGSADTAKIAKVLLGKSEDSAHTLAETLFGEAAKETAGKGTTEVSAGEVLAKSVMAAVAAKGMASLVTSFLGSKKGEDTDGGVDLSGLAGLAKAFLKNV